MELPYIKPLEKVSQVLDLLYNDKESAERLKLLNDTQVAINKQLERYKDIADAQVHLNAAKALQDEVRELKSSADKYVADKKAAIDDAYSEMMAKKKELDEAPRVQSEMLANRARDLNRRETELNAKELNLSEREALLPIAIARADERRKQADEIVIAYEEKLAKFKALAA